MSPRPFKNATFASAFAFLAPTIVIGAAFPCAVFAQNYADRGPGVRVTQASDGSLTTAGGEVTLKTESSVVAGRPQFRYLPGSNGDTVLTADFEGLTWNYPTKVIRLNSPEKGLSNIPFTGIKEIRIGQFQASPSILRVSFVARDPAVLKKVAIGAAPGVLKLSWKGAGTLNSSLPTKAPSVRLASTQQMPPVASGKPGLAMAAASSSRPSSGLSSASSSASSSTSTTATADSSVLSKAAKAGWLARLRSKTKEYFSAPAEPPAEEAEKDSAKDSAKDSEKDSAKETVKDSAKLSALESTGESKRQSKIESIKDYEKASAKHSIRQPLKQRGKTTEDEQSASAPVAPAIAQTSPAAAKVARIPAPAPSISLLDGGSIVNSFPTLPPPKGSDRTVGGAKLANRDSDTDLEFTNSKESRPSRELNASRDSNEIAGSGDFDKTEVPLGPPPLVTLETADAQGSGAKLEIFRVERPDGKPLGFKSFRLHNPERYVVDMPDYRELANALLPDVSTSPLVSSMRVGLPGEVEGAGRLVLQLTDDTVSIDESFNSGSSYMTVTLAKGLSGNSGIARSGSLAGLAGGNGPILVPRAPSETVVVLDAGHGGSDPGAVRGDVQEKEVTLQIIAKLKKVLESKGARIVLTRADDTFVSLEDRVKITNAVLPNLFLSVHINSLESTSNIYGIETYFQTDQSRPLADRVHASLVSGLGAPDRSVRKARFYVINHTPVPAILAEVGYITNKLERDRLISSDYQQKVASALARGVMLYLQEIKSQNGFANNSSGSVGSSADVQKPSKLATGSWKPTK
ncbi:N-acetylmuramoyl-L-alanine amidase [bacterium]|nr:N-acetylmuramoyl-L-alanine amidase [bacterium]MBP9808702.1 N-acetylmuramoyl-L-alanine amidase [bacterium]